MNKHHFTIILFALITLIGTSVSAQRSLNRTFEYATMTADTNTNVETVLITFDKFIMANYDLAWQAMFANVSGTTAATATLEASLCESCSDWSAVETFSVSGTSDTLFQVSSFPGLRVRLKVVSSGTGVTALRNYVRFLKRKD